MIEIIPYTDQYAAEFKALNLEWLDRYRLTESHDFILLDHPQGVIDEGGLIFLALDGEIAVGTAALIHVNHGVYELAKMSVSSTMQGRGIGAMLLRQCLQSARDLGAKKVFLFSNSQLTKAIGLYEKHGFSHIAMEDAPYETADVKMELNFMI